MNNDLVHLQSQIDQDGAECSAWWRDATTEERLAVWDAIQQDFDDPVMEVTSRFAQLAFSQVALKHLNQRERETRDDRESEGN